MLNFDVVFHKASGFEFLLKIYSRIFFMDIAKVSFHSPLYVN
jgi:hypothetical protein